MCFSSAWPTLIERFWTWWLGWIKNTPYSWLNYMYLNTVYIYIYIYFYIIKLFLLSLCIHLHVTKNVLLLSWGAASPSWPGYFSVSFRWVEPALAFVNSAVCFFFEKTLNHQPSLSLGQFVLPLWNRYIVARCWSWGTYESCPIATFHERHDSFT